MVLVKVQNGRTWCIEGSCWLILVSAWSIGVDDIVLADDNFLVAYSQ